MGISRYKLTAALICLLAIAGCSANNQTNDTKVKTQSYPQDGYMGLTSVNPNNPLHPTYHHYRDDTSLMKAVLAQLQGIEDTRITLRGPNAQVRIKPKPGLTDHQVEELRSQALMALNTNMPRYRVNVMMER